MARKGSGWHDESRRHSLARRGVRTVPSRITVNEDSGVWFESSGILGDMVSLMQLVGFDDLMEKKKASGIPKEQYESDAEQVIIFPSEETERSARWLMREYIDGGNKRKKQVKKIIDIAIDEIESRLGKTKSVDIRIDLHKSRKLLTELRKELK